MKIYSKKITFHSNATDFDIMHPYPTSRSMPNWFRKMPGVSEDQVMTVKKCIPFLDSMTAGYQIPLPADVTWSKSTKSFITHGMYSLNSDHISSQTSDVPIPEEYDPQPHKWINPWHIKTPKGYSVLFTHPMNRSDLPFMSFTGIVDTDKHPLIINFPFVLRKDFEGTIKAGTPIIQLIPFKRESWNMDVIDQGKSYEYAEAYKAHEPPFGFYKNNFWHKKRYT